MRLTASLFRRRAVLAAPLAASSSPTERCCTCGSTNVGYHNHRDQPFCWPCADGDDGLDDRIATSEQQAQLARTQSRCLALAQQLEARYVRYAWTEQLAADLRAIAHDTPTEQR